MAEKNKHRCPGVIEWVPTEVYQEILEFPIFGEELASDWLIEKWASLLECFQPFYNVLLQDIYTNADCFSVLSTLKNANIPKNHTEKEFEITDMLIDVDELKTRLKSGPLSDAFKALKEFWSERNNIEKLEKVIKMENLSQLQYKSGLLAHLFKELGLHCATQEFKRVCPCSSQCSVLNYDTEVVIGNDKTWSGILDALIKTTSGSRLLNVLIKYTGDGYEDTDDIKSQGDGDLAAIFERELTNLDFKILDKWQSERQALLQTIVLGHVEGNGLKKDDKKFRCPFSTTVLIDRFKVNIFLYNSERDILLGSKAFPFHASLNQNYVHTELLVLQMWLISHFHLLCKPISMIGFIGELKDSGFKESMKKVNKYQYYEKIDSTKSIVSSKAVHPLLLHESRPPPLKRQKTN